MGVMDQQLQYWQCRNARFNSKFVLFWIKPVLKTSQFQFTLLFFQTKQVSDNCWLVKRVWMNISSQLLCSGFVGNNILDVNVLWERNIHLAKHSGPEEAVWKEPEQKSGPFLSGQWNMQWPASSGNMLPWQQSWLGTGKRNLYLHGTWMFCFNSDNMQTGLVGLVCAIPLQVVHSPTINPMLIYKKTTSVANMLTRKPAVTNNAPMIEVARIPSLAHATEATGPRKTGWAVLIHKPA